MFSDELKELLIQVITSWQVLAVTGAVILYSLLVSYVARLYHRPRVAKPSTARKAKTVAKSAPEVSDDDDLGIDEETA